MTSLGAELAARSRQVEIEMRTPGMGRAPR